MAQSPGRNSADTQATAQSERPADAQPAADRPKRLVSLDAFRGLTILGMLLVNNVALDTATPKHLTHAAWNQGINFADLVYPWFLLIVGVAIPYSVASARSKGVSAWTFSGKALNRAFWLVALGCLIDSSIMKTPVFDLGVLQLIGLAYLVAAVLYPLRLPWRLITAGVLLVAHWAAIRFLPVPGIGAGYFTEDKNLIKHLNEVYLQPYHLAGLVSVAPTAALVMIGSAIGDLLRVKRISAGRKAVDLALIGFGLMAVGWLWNLDLPFNKPVWSSSYILFTAGLGSVTLAALYGLIDITGWTAWAFPLVVFGSNAIIAYVAPILVKLYVLQGWTDVMPDGSRLPLQDAFLRVCKAYAGPVGGGWLYTALYIAIWWLVLLVLHRRKVFLRV